MFDESFRPQDSAGAVAPCVMDAITVSVPVSVNVTLPLPIAPAKPPLAPPLNVLASTWMPLSVLRVTATDAEAETGVPRIVSKALACAELLAPLAGGAKKTSGGLSVSPVFGVVALAKQWITPEAPMMAAAAEDPNNAAPIAAAADNN